MAERPLRYFELRSRAKYEVETAISFETGIESAGFDLPFGGITPPGLLYVDAGFVWDGPSGPTIDRKWNLKASLKHDLLVKLLRHTGFGDPATHKKRQKLCDQIYRDTCLEAIDLIWEMMPRRSTWQRLKASTWRRFALRLAALHYRALQIFGRQAGDIEGEREVRVAV
jgi:hypothetical protein